VTEPVFFTEVEEPFNGEVVLTLRIPREVIEAHKHDLTLYAEYDPTAGISLDTGPAWMNSVELHPESMPVAMMRYAFLLARLGYGQDAEVIDFKEHSKE